MSEPTSAQLDLVRALRLRRGEHVFAVTLPLEPMVARRGRAVVRYDAHGRAYADVTDDAGYRRWKLDAITLLREWWRDRPAVRLPLVVRVVAVLPRPKAAPEMLTVRGRPFRYPFPWTEGRNPHLGTEDLDNLRKPALDVLTKAGVIADDRLVVEDGGSRKVYAAQAEEPCVEIRAWHA